PITYYTNAAYEAPLIEAALNAVLGAGFVSVAPSGVAGQFLVTFLGLGTTNPAALITGTDTTTPAAVIGSAITTPGAAPAANTAIAQLLQSDQLATSSLVTVNSDGLLDLNGHSQQ